MPYLDMIVATKIPKAIIRDNVSYIFIVPPPLHFHFEGNKSRAMQRAASPSLLYHYKTFYQRKIPELPDRALRDFDFNSLHPRR